MRIIAGTHKSRKLKTLSGDNTRPSSDRLKEALFNKIGPYFNGETILDIFSGSGAISFEALSRGMSHATCIEKSRKAQRIIIENAKDLKLENKLDCILGDAKGIIGTLKMKYDIIFMDPPYDYQDTQMILEMLHPYLKDAGTIFVETDKFTTLPDKTEHFVKVEEKQYGFAKIHTYEMSQ